MTSLVDGSERRPRLFRRLAALLSAIALANALSVAVTTESASAYALNGCKWGDSDASTPGTTVYMRNQMPSGTNYSTQTIYARNSWNVTTDIILLGTSGSVAFASKLRDNGNNGYDGMAYRSCLSGWFTNCTATLNPYYTDSMSGARMRAVIQHEQGHCLGLGHRTTLVQAIMYECPVCVYNTYGVNTPQTDDKNGINSLY